MPLAALAARDRLRIQSAASDGSNLDAIIGAGAFRYICTCNRQSHDATNISLIRSEEVQALLKSLSQSKCSGRHAGQCARSQAAGNPKSDDVMKKEVGRFLNSGCPVQRLRKPFGSDRQVGNVILSRPRLQQQQQQFPSFALGNRRLRRFGRRRCSSSDPSRQHDSDPVQPPRGSSDPSR